MSVPPSPTCHSVEMDVYLGQTQLSCPCRLSFADTSGPGRDSPSSVRKHIAKNRQMLLHHFFIAASSYSVVLPTCLVTGQQGNRGQYSGFLGHVRSRPPGRKIMSRGGRDGVAVLRQLVQCACGHLRKSQQHILRCQHLHVFVHPRTNTPAQEKKGPDAAPSGLSLLHGLTSGNPLHTSTVHTSKR